MTYLEVLTKRLKNILLEVNASNELAKKHGTEIPSTFILVYEDLTTNKIDYAKLELHTNSAEEKAGSIEALRMTLEQTKKDIKPVLLISVINAWYVERTKEELEKQDISDIKVSEDPQKKSCILISGEINNQLITLMKREGVDEITEVIDKYDPNNQYGEFQFILNRNN